MPASKPALSKSYYKAKLLLSNQFDLSFKFIVNLKWCILDVWTPNSSSTNSKKSKKGFSNSIFSKAFCRKFPKGGLPTFLPNNHSLLRPNRLVRKPANKRLQRQVRWGIISRYSLMGLQCRVLLISILLTSLRSLNSKRLKGRSTPWMWKR